MATIRKKGKQNTSDQSVAAGGKQIFCEYLSASFKAYIDTPVPGVRKTDLSEGIQSSQVGR